MLSMRENHEYSRSSVASLTSQMPQAPTLLFGGSRLHTATYPVETANIHIVDPYYIYIYIFFIYISIYDPCIYMAQDGHYPHGIPREDRLPW